MQCGTRREVLSEEAAWSWLLILVHFWSPNVLAAAVAAAAADVLSGVVAREAVPEEAQVERAVPGVEVEAQAEQAALEVPAAPAEQEERGEPEGEEAREGQEGQEEQEEREVGAERVEELPGEGGAECPTRI